MSTDKGNVAAYWRANLKLLAALLWSGSWCHSALACCS